MKKLIIALFALAANSAFAGTSTGYVTDLTVDSAGKITITMSVSTTSPPACATQLQKFAMDATTTGGKELGSMVKSGFSMGRQVTVTGTGTCTVYSNTENISTLKVFQ